MREAWDDEETMARLAEALRVAEEVPPEFVEMGKAAFTWRGIDAELADLVYDSAVEPDGETPALTRTETATPRFMTYQSPAVKIELEIAGDALHGQVISLTRAGPGGAGAGRVRVERAAGAATGVPVDEVGGFVVRPIPDALFRLHCTIGDVSARTTWIRL